MGRYMAVLVLGVLASSCAPDDGGFGERRVEVTDSAGVRIVHNHGRADELTVREFVRFGVVDGDPNLLFNEIRSIAVQPDGSLWVADSHESIRHYAMDGVYLGSVGGVGDGPGESRRGYGDIWVTDSTLYASAWSQGTFQLFDTDAGGFIGSRPVYTDNGAPLVVLGPSVDAWYFLNVGFPSPEQRRGRETWTLYEGPATSPDLEWVTELEGHPFLSLGQGRWTKASFFDGFPSVGVDGRGNIYYSHAADYQIDIFSAAGSLLKRIRRSTARRPYEDGLEGEIEDGLRDGWRVSRTVDESQIRQRLEAALPVSDPEWIPSIDQVLVAADGALWVRRADLHPRPAMRAVAAAYDYVLWAWLEEWRADWRFDLFSAQGEYRGSVTLPSNFTPMAVTNSHMFGSVRDDLDVEYVVGFEVRPR